MTPFLRRYSKKVKCEDAKASAAEVRSQLCTCLDMGYIGEADFLDLKHEGLLLSKQIAGFMQYLAKSKPKARS